MRLRVIHYLSDDGDVLELLDLAPERVEDRHVVRLLEEDVLQVLEDGDGVSEEDLQGKNQKFMKEGTRGISDRASSVSNDEGEKRGGSGASIRV